MQRCILPDGKGIPVQIYDTQLHMWKIPPSLALALTAVLNILIFTTSNSVLFSDPNLNDDYLIPNDKLEGFSPLMEGNNIVMLYQSTL